MGRARCRRRRRRHGRRRRRPNAHTCVRTHGHRFARGGHDERALITCGSARSFDSAVESPNVVRSTAAQLAHSAIVRSSAAVAAAAMPNTLRSPRLVACLLRVHPLAAARRRCCARTTPAPNIPWLAHAIQIDASTACACVRMQVCIRRGRPTSRWKSGTLFVSLSSRAEPARRN